MIKHKGLGRGLDALLGGYDESSSAPEVPSSNLTTLALHRLQAGKYQPRTHMDETSLNELADSIKTHGLMQPITVRALSKSNGHIDHEIIAGERRFRAAKIAGLQDVPVIIREVSDELALALALIENIQREDLNALEEAQAIKRLIEEFKYSHDQAAQAIGRSRSATSNLLRLLNLAEPVQTMLLAGDLDMGHARALLALEKPAQLMLAQRISAKQLSVRDTEKLVAETLKGGSDYAPSRNPGSAKNDTSLQDRKSRDLARLEEELADALGTRVQIKADSKRRGTLVLHFFGDEEFEGLVGRLKASTLN
jgi:ParB family transcriptional regulator, chromosome partitioning protein